jgi:hypothetical protein
MRNKSLHFNATDRGDTSVGVTNGGNFDSFSVALFAAARLVYMISCFMGLFFHASKLLAPKKK